MTQTEALRLAGAGGFGGALRLLYPDECEESRLGRVESLLAEHLKRFGPAETRLFSAPGRTELAGNHTDHNGGRVLAAAVDLDAAAAVSAADDSRVEIISRGFPRAFTINLSNLEPLPAERGTTEALVRGVATEFARRGRRIGGFRAVVDSRVLSGSGLSSSAAFEILAAAVFNGLYNGWGVSASELAEAGWAAENRFFGKPCGRMDQTVCALGGIAAIDFENGEEPRIERLDFDFEAAGCTLFVVDTGGSHADLTPDYAAIPEEMRSVAAVFGGQVLRNLGEPEPAEFLRRALPFRGAFGDRALLRAVHFFAENRRVSRMTGALRRGAVEEYLGLVRLSGGSSWRLLQNCYPPSLPREQGIPLALLAAEEFLQGSGACRVHGGGFAGTIQAYVPNERRKEFENLMNGIFGAGSARRLGIRPAGAGEIGPDRI